MTIAAAIVLAAALFEDDDRVVAELTNNRACDLRAINARCAHFGTQHQDVVEHHRLASFTKDFLNGKYVVFRDAILFAACFDNCEYGRNLKYSIESAGFGPANDGGEYTAGGDESMPVRCLKTGR